MKLQKQLSKRTKEKDYFKHVLNIPPMIIKEAGFDEYSELEAQVKEGKIVIKRKDKK
ncbi:MAG: hypothetical protein AABX66_02140 [Nanoarchaeota archaeon]